MSMRTTLVTVFATVLAVLLFPIDARAACDPGLDLVISEFMASNNHGLTDEDGEFSDWVEVYNPCQPSVNLAGWALTDDPDDLDKWTFPAVSLARGEALVVFASSKSRAVAGLPLHTNFKLEAAGEYLALVRPDGTTIAQEFAPQFPAQVSDMSYGFEQSATVLLSKGSTSTYHVPTAGDASLGSGWTSPAFDDTAWPAGPTGLGFLGGDSTGFDVTLYRANVTVSNLATAEAVIDDPATHLGVAHQTAAVVNYLNTGGVAHYGGDLPFPGTTIGTDANDFVVLVQGDVIIPAAGPWTFGVNSDDGFGLELSREPYLFETSFPSVRGPADTLATFDIPEPGRYRLRLVMFERGGGSGLELFAAQGAFASWSAAAFDLVGDTANGGLPVSGLVGEIGTDVGAVMSGVNASLWARLDFDVADPLALGLLILRLEYEDGVVAYLNGQEVAARNAPSPVLWDAAALADRPLADAGNFERIDLTDVIGLVQPGTNVLALHGLNDAVADPDFLVLPELTAVDAAFDLGAPRFFTAPTPGGINTATGYLAVSATPQFSHPSATFTTPFVLTLSSAAPAGVIRYTLDGSVPTETGGTVYTAPIAIADSARVTARVFEPGLAPSRIIGRLYGELDASVTAFNSNLPIVVVHTFGSGIAEDWLTPTLTSIIDTTAGRATITDAADFVGPAGIRIRGSSSRSFPKKQFALETWDDDNKDKEVTFLDLPPESDWILYAPYSEKGLIHNVMAYAWYNATGRYAVRTRFCEMYLKTSTGPVTAADYAGIYVVMEKIKQGPDRVNITELLPTDETEPGITGGYIFKKDRLDPGDSGFLTSTGQRLAYVDPKEVEITTTQAAWIKGFLDEFESVLYGANFADPVNGYAKHLDTGSFIDHHILVELTKNIDGYRLSSFMFKDRSGKLHMGPVWDYNLSLGNANYLDGWLPTGWYHDLLGDGDYPYYRRLFSDPEFAQQYADRWFELRRGPFSNAALLADFDGAIALLQESAPRNFQRWPIIGTYVWPNWYIGTTWADDVAWSRQWLVDRLAWFDAQFPAPPVFSQQGGSVPIGYNLTISAAAGVIYYTVDGSDPRLPGGALSPAALPYSGPLVLLQPTQVRARTLDTGIWSALNAATFDPVPIAVVNEALPANVSTIADEQGDYDPWIEIYNPSADYAALGGMFLTDDPGVPDKWEIPAGSDLCGHERLLVWADGEASEGALHASFVLTPAAGTVYLFDAAGVLVNSLTRPALPPNVSYGRQPDGGSTLVRFIHPTGATANLPNATPIILNEYNGVLPTRLLSGGASDPYWGRILGNGGDWIELVVVQDHLDLRGFRVIVRDKSGLAGDNQQTLVFTNDALLADLRAGTIITVAADLASDLSFDPLVGDFWINLRSGAAGDGLYISALPFSTSNDNTQISIIDPNGVVVFGPAGEGINPASGVGNDEVLKLEADPGPDTTAASAYRDGSSSTFGSPNLWSGGAVTQSFAALRAPTTFACAIDADCNDANPCTDDACVAGHCVNTPNIAPCDDGNPCTDGDLCSNRICRGVIVGSCCLSGCACDDASVCTIDSCGPAGCLHAPICALSGTVRYYRDAAVAAEPSAKGVPGVAIDVNTDGLADATTTGGGVYQGGDWAGVLHVEPLPWLGNPRAADHNGAITSFDAALTARAAVGSLIFSGNQVLAGDVSGTAGVTSFDAARIAQFAARLIDHFEVATSPDVGTGSDWRFLRCDTYDDASSQNCGAPLHLHDPLTQAEVGDFYAVLYGDVSGNWMPAAGLAPGAPAVEQGAVKGLAAAEGTSPEELAAARADLESAARLAGHARPRPPRAAAAGPAALSLDTVTGRMARGERRRIVVRIDMADGVEALDLQLAYPAKRLGIIAIEPAGIGAGLSVATNDFDGVLRLGLYGLEPLRGSGTLVAITVEAFQTMRRLPPLRIGGTANEGAIELVTAQPRAKK